MKVSGMKVSGMKDRGTKTEWVVMTGEEIPGEGTTTVLKMALRDVASSKERTKKTGTRRRMREERKATKDEVMEETGHSGIEGVMRLPIGIKEAVMMIGVRTLRDRAIVVETRAGKPETTEDLIGTIGDRSGIDSVKMETR